MAFSFLCRSVYPLLVYENRIKHYASSAGAYGLGSAFGFICFHFAVAGVPHLLSNPRLVRLRSRNAVIDC